MYDYVALYGFANSHDNKKNKQEGKKLSIAIS
jgi:hypothetical protein